MTTHTRTSFRLPPQFQPVPPPKSEDFAEWSRAVSGRSAADPNSSVAEDLLGLTDAMESTDRPGSVWFALIPALPYHQCIPAFGWIAAEPAGGLRPHDLLPAVDQAERSVPPSAWTRRVTLRDIDGCSALVIHQFQAVTGATEAQIVERCGALMVDEASDTAYTLELVAADMRAFEDMTETACEILQGLRPADEGS